MLSMTKNICETCETKDKCDTCDIGQYSKAVMEGTFFKHWMRMEDHSIEHFDNAPAHCKDVLFPKPEDVERMRNRILKAIEKEQLASMGTPKGSENPKCNEQTCEEDDDDELQAVIIS